MVCALLLDDHDDAADNSIPHEWTGRSHHGVQSDRRDDGRTKVRNETSDVPSTTTACHLFVEYINTASRQVFHATRNVSQ